MGLKELAILATVPLVTAILISMAGFPQWSAMLGGLALLAVAILANKSVGLKLQWQQGVVGILALALAFPLANPFGEFTQTVTGRLTDLGGLGTASVADGGNQIQTVKCPDGSVAESASQCPSDGGKKIVTTTGTLSIVAKNILNKSDDNINPGGQYFKDGGYRSLSFSSGVASIASLDPFATLTKISVGTDGTFYWTQIPNYALNGDTSPQLTTGLVRVFTRSDARAYSDGSGGTTKFADLTNGTANQSVGAGGAMKFFHKFEPLSLYTGIRAPALGYSVNTSAVSDVSVASLSTISCPATLVSDTSGRVLFRCFDTGVDWLVDVGSKTPITEAEKREKNFAGSIEYGAKEWLATVQYLASIDPAVVGGCSAGTEREGVRAYVFDRDEDFRSPVGQLYFVDPQTTNTNLGSTNSPSIYVCPT